MDFILNKNAKLKVGGKKAPKGTVQELVTNICNWVKDNELAQLLESEEEEKEIKHKLYIHINDLFYENDFDYTFNFVCPNSSVYVVGKGITKSEVPYIIVTCGSGNFDCMLAFLYWDGQKPRIYVPTKGNKVNTRQERSIGGYQDLDYVWSLEYGLSPFERIIPENYKTDPDFEKSDFKFVADQLYEETGIDKRELTNENIEYISASIGLNARVKDLYFEIDEDLCLQDFESRIETI